MSTQMVVAPYVTTALKTLLKPSLPVISPNVSIAIGKIAQSILMQNQLTYQT